jgi:hypothetical protein
MLVLHSSELDIDGFARWPVLVGGRVMAMDTLGRFIAFAVQGSAFLDTDIT